MKRTCLLIALLGLLILPLTADELWTELLPDHGAVLLSVSQELDGQVKAAGSWDAFTLNARPVEADLWSISPLGGGLSWGVLGSIEQPRYLGLGYDGDLPGERWYDRLVIYGKTPVELNF